MLRVGLLGLCLWVLLCVAAEAETAAERYQPLSIPPPAAAPAYVPFPALSTAPLDEGRDGVGVAQQQARAQGAQARMLWIDGLANIDRVNSAEKIQTLVTQIKNAGFNMVVLDVKPLPGFTLYPSAFAPKMPEWKGATLPAEFDPLAELLKAGHAAGLSVITSMNVFCEGHRWVGKGVGYTHPEWQATLLEPVPVLVGEKYSMRLQALKTGTTTLPMDSISVVTNISDLPPHLPSAVVAVTDASRKVVAVMLGTEAQTGLPVPKGGGVLAAEGAAGDFLRGTANLGATLTISGAPNYVLSGAASDNGIALWTNPNDPLVQQRILDMINELVTKYPVDGVIFDDRMRYSGVNADFSEASRKAFEAYVGKQLNWPYDVLRPASTFPELARELLPGPYFDDWRLWHATIIRNWLARAAATVKGIRPAATVSVYTGSWYGEYFDYGSNWAADDFQAGFRDLTDAYRKTGYAGMLDWMTTGCYYNYATVSEANAAGVSPGFTIEAAGQLSNRAANNATWVYAGILLANFDGHPEALARALQAAAASTQGIMVFDLSHKIDQFWPVFQQAFAKPAIPPHAMPGLFDQVRAEVARHRAAGIIDPPVIIQNGAEGTGL